MKRIIFVFGLLVIAPSAWSQKISDYSFEYTEVYQVKAPENSWPKFPSEKFDEKIGKDIAGAFYDGKFGASKDDISSMQKYGRDEMIKRLSPTFGSESGRKGVIPLKFDTLEDPELQEDTDVWSFFDQAEEWTRQGQAYGEEALAYCVHNAYFSFRYHKVPGMGEMPLVHVVFKGKDGKWYSSKSPILMGHLGSMTFRVAEAEDIQFYSDWGHVVMTQGGEKIFEVAFDVLGKKDLGIFDGTKTENIYVRKLKN